MAPADGLDVLLWAGYSAKKGAVTVTESFLLKGAYLGYMHVRVTESSGLFLCEWMDA